MRTSHKFDRYIRYIRYIRYTALKARHAAYGGHCAAWGWRGATPCGPFSLNQHVPLQEHISAASVRYILCAQCKNSTAHSQQTGTEQAL